MPYTPITDGEEMRRAFEALRDAFLTGAVRVEGEYYGDPFRYLHQNKNDLWGGIFYQEQKNTYRIGFGRGRVYDGAPAILEMSVPGQKGMRGSFAGLFVQDKRGNRYLTHSGNLTIPHHHWAKGNVHGGLMQFTGNNCWIDVEGEDKSRFLVVRLDRDHPSAVIDRIDRVTSVIESFKKGKEGDNCPLQLDDDSPSPPEDLPTRRAPSALNTILYGPPGTGKTYATFRRCVEVCDGKEKCPDGREDIRTRYKELVSEGRIEFVTFHQSYGYEEFVEGLRPDSGSEGEGAGAGFRLVPTDGVLKRMAERARLDRRPHVLVIDEINRANVSKVMGELVTLLEEDKRKGAENEVAVTLPHSRKPFALPRNLHVLGTMNTADRSIALLDTALRRRFDFEELDPDPEALRSVDGINLPDVLGAINERLEYLVDRDHLIGHAWLMGVGTREDVDRIMRRKIIPLIAEYFHDDWEKVRAVLGGPAAPNPFIGRTRLDRPPGLGDDGVDGERYRWTVRDTFAEDAYDRLISGEAGQDPGQAPEAEDEGG